ncbi:MAG: DUF1499 domain-containing protein [Planctomycetes bacterium]|nr:DUF1499 domain-containing protein [Planctomycetota bacterium]
MPQKALRYTLTVVSILLLVALGVVACVGCAGIRPTKLGVDGGRLSPCPSSPNCVNSQAQAELDEHFVAALSVEGDPARAWSAAVRAAKALPRASVVEERDGYLWLEIRSRVFGFADDLELALDAAHQRVEVRSCSRLGHSNLGVNRARVEALRGAYALECERSK